MTDGAAALVHAASNRVVRVHRIGCVLHVNHLSVVAEMESVFFVGPLGKGSWQEWPGQHLLGLLGSLRANMSTSYVSNTRWK